MADDEQQQADDTALGFKDGKLTFPLSKPIKAHGKEVDAIVLREPTGRDVIEVGTPIDFDPMTRPPRLLMNSSRMADMISRLAAVPPSSIEQMTPKELSQLGWILAPFFSPV